MISSKKENGIAVATIQKVTARQKLEISLLVGAVAISRLAFRSRDLYDLDSVNFALGMQRFDTRVHQPHPPGYFLYVCIGRLVNFVVHDANLALVLVSVAAGMATVALIYLLAQEWFGPRAAQFAGILFLISPLAWFHGTVALTYSVEAAFSALLGYLCWRIHQGNAVFVVPAAIALGVSAGIRPSSLVFLGPLFLFSLWSVPIKAVPGFLYPEATTLKSMRPPGSGDLQDSRKWEYLPWNRFRKSLLGLGVLALTGAAWFLPMIYVSGGFAKYFDALASLWRMVPSKNTVFNSPPATSLARALFIAFIYFLCFGLASFAPLLAPRQPDPSHKARTLFTAIWVMPALCFFTFIFLKFVNSGYLLLVAVPGCLWIGHWIADWYDRARWPRAVRLALIAVCVAVNVTIFLAFPAYCSFRSVRHFEAELDGVETALPQVGAPSDLLVVSFDNHFLGYRHAGYYLPSYMTLEYPEAHLAEGTRIFSMTGRSTELLSSLPSGAWSRFVLFPLPAGNSEYAHYIDDVVKLLPAKDLQTVSLNGHTFVTAPIRDLPLLFPPGPLAAR